MGIMDKAKKLFNITEEEYYDDAESAEIEEYEEDPEEDYEPVSRFNPRSVKAEQNKVVSINTNAKLQVAIFKPKNLDDAKEVGTAINQKKTVIMNLDGVNKDTAVRIYDFISGVTYANKGNLRRIADITFIVTPYNVDVNGDIISEISGAGYKF